MNKVICDICGTAYSDSMDNCPVCGCSRDFGLEDLSNEFLMDDAAAQPAAPRKNREIFDFDEVNRAPVSDPDLDDDDYDEDEEYETESRSNVGLVIVLVILIVLLLLTAGFFFLRYFLPNMVREPEETTVPTTEYVEPETTVAPETGVPCTDIVLPGGKVEVKVGGMFLVNAQAFPEDTTDVLTYTSADESIATVSESGTVTGVAEGQTVVTISCGKATVKCNILVTNDVAEETEPAGTIPAIEIAEADETAGEDSAEETTEETTEAKDEKETEATEATEEVTIPEGETLKLKKTDITLFSRYTSVELELDCEIPADKIKWFTMDSTVAIVHDGVVTATGSGITRIYGEYESQQVECIIRCNFA